MLLVKFIANGFKKIFGISLRRKLGYLGIVFGALGAWYCSNRMPDFDAPVYQVSRWAAADMAFSIITMASLLAAMKDISSLHLKVLDLIWVGATAVGVVFAVIQTFSSMADETRDRYHKQWVESRERASGLLSRAFLIECADSSNGPGLQCASLSRLKTSVIAHGLIDDETVSDACPTFPIDLSAPRPEGFTYERIEGCISAKYISYVVHLPVVLDKQDSEEWRQKTRLWPLLLIFFVALRLSKSIAEVFWK